MKFIFPNNKYKLSECLKRFFAKAEADAILAPRTIQKYKEVAGMLIKTLGDINIKKINEMTVIELKQKLNQRNLSASRKNHFLIIVKSVLAQCIREGLKVFDPVKITKFTVPQKEVSYLTKEQLIILASAPSNKTITGLRMRAIIQSLISTGCRVSELLGLNKNQIDFEISAVVSIRTKGNRPHQIIFNPASQLAIQEYLEMRGDDNCDALFATINASKCNRLQVNDLQRGLRNLGKKLGFKINVTPHLIARRSVATLMFKEGVPLGVIQKFLNHSSSQVTTRFYIGNLDFEEVKKHHKVIMNFGIESEAGKEGDNI
ncbi:MAG: tyrosine-type recombinase/integrase [Candidatus Moraniibacteriota bacterium]